MKYPKNYYVTSPSYYLTGWTALNIIPKDVDSGDWHPYQAVPYDGDLPWRYAGDGEPSDYNTNHILGDYGIYDCKPILEGMIGMPDNFLPDLPVYCANHIRACLDLFLAKCCTGKYTVRALEIEGIFGLDSLAEMRTIVQGFPDEIKTNPQYKALLEEIDYAERN